MSKQFQTAEGLMEYLKQQIVHYSNGEEFEFIEPINSPSNNYNNSIIDLSRLSQERDANNVLWNVSAERPITSHRKLTGKLIVFTKKIVRKLLRWYVSQTFELQSAFNGSVTRSINEITNSLQTITSKMEEIESRFVEQASRTKELVNSRELEKSRELENYKRIVKEQSLELTELQSKIEDISLLVYGDQHKEISENVNSLKENMLERIQHLENDIRLIDLSNSSEISRLNKDLNFTQELFKNETNFLNYRIRKFTKSNPKQMIDNTILNVEATDGLNIESQTICDFDYLHFENKFRGSVEEIKNRQKVYLPYFNDKNNILDIGCGRGEFIELMIENNISVKGIDLNDDMVEYCQDRGLPVTKNDAVSCLKSIENASLGGIFLGQVIEHMPFDQIIIMVELAYKKLKPGSYLIMETPNPLSLAIFYRTFYVDPTHVKPIHPLTIQYVVESVGFSKTELQYSSSVESNWWLPKLQSDSNSGIINIEEFNHGIERVNNLLYGHLDYAIIAKK